MARRGFVPPSERQQLAGIGLSDDARRMLHTELYSRLPMKASHEFWECLRSCFDPSGHDWDNLEPPRQSEWLEAMLHKTPDQSFKDYVASRPNRPERSRNVIYLLPICEPGDLEAPPFPKGPWPSWRMLEAAVERFFAPLSVRTLPAVPMWQLSPRPDSRKGSLGVEQWHAGMALDALVRQVPKDAYGLMAVTMCDLYPKPEWNFVYGLARLTQRVGIFSFVRHTPGPAPEAWSGAYLLYRSLKTMLHEIGHMFGLKHCTWYNCLMRGSNGEGVEHQLNPLYLCPVCLRKLHWCIGFDVRERYAGLLEIYQEYAGVYELFAKDCAFLQSRLAKLANLPDGSTMISELSAYNSQSGKHVPAPPRSLHGRHRAASTPSAARNRSLRTSATFSQNASRIIRMPDCNCCNQEQEKLNEARPQSRSNR